jgi:hypothetical protein
MTYDELRSRFTGLLKRRDLTTTDRDAFIQSGLSRCLTLLRVPAMEAVDTITFDASYGGKLPVPADYLKMKSMTTGTDEIKQKDLTFTLRLRENSGTPCAYTRRGGDFWLGPYPLDGTEVVIEYYQELPALVNGTDTNWLATIKPYAILHAALAEAAPTFVDRRGDSWEKKFLQSIAELQDQADQDELVNATVEPAIRYPDDDC